MGWADDSRTIPARLEVPMYGESYVAALQAKLDAVRQLLDNDVRMKVMGVEVVTVDEVRAALGNGD